jgi:hypothetical protein
MTPPASTKQPPTPPPRWCRTSITAEEEHHHLAEKLVARTLQPATASHSHATAGRGQPPPRHSRPQPSQPRPATDSSQPRPGQPRPPQPPASRGPRSLRPSTPANAARRRHRRRSRPCQLPLPPAASQRRQPPPTRLPSCGHRIRPGQRRIRGKPSPPQRRAAALPTSELQAVRTVAPAQNRRRRSKPRRRRPWGSRELPAATRREGAGEGAAAARVCGSHAARARTTREGRTRKDDDASKPIRLTDKHHFPMHHASCYICNPVSRPHLHSPHRRRHRWGT